jgi:acetoin utilization deacetylase AcuC-like enzyme
MRRFRLEHRLRTLLFGAHGVVFHDPAYRFPLSGLEGQTGFEPRRADYVVSFLLDGRALRPEQLVAPRRVAYRDLARVHTADYLEAIGSPSVLADIFAVDAAGTNADEVLRTVRLACGGTLGAARESLRRRTPCLNLLGGFHHAGPGRGGGFCVVNDVAVAIAALRAEGFRGRVLVLDLDVHPPDGLAECLRDDRDVWIGSLSGMDWGKLERVDETVLGRGCGDAAYLEALEALLARMPRGSLAFVIAGGDVLAGDRMGGLGLTLAGVRRRDLRAARALRHTPAAWLSGGGYSAGAWRALSGTALAVIARSAAPIPDDYDPMRERFESISEDLDDERLGAGSTLGPDDLADALGLRTTRTRLLLDYYTAQGLEYGFHRYGILEHIRRLGYDQFRVAIDQASVGDCLRLWGRFRGAEHLLVECVLEVCEIATRRVLYVHWLMLSNPRARFDARRPRLPGQEQPGLGLAREAGEMLARMARRLGLAGVAFRPAWYHTAFSGRYHFQFVDPARQGRFEAAVRDLGGVSLLEATTALAEGRVHMNGEPYRWEADEMVFWLDEEPARSELVDAERDRVRFEIAPPAQP